ncbi:MAG: Ig-like domain-containing protein [Tannerella sp.]|jgi:uncharacterized protein YjdB|nr:Ig-like domain-containing protein [Tannerella sp.]
MKKLFLLAFTAALIGCAEYPDMNVDKTVFINKATVSLYVGKTEQLSASPAGNTFQWSSDDPEVATVSANGLVTAVGVGNANISATVGDMTAKSRVSVSAFIPLTDINLSQSRLILTQYQLYLLQAKPVPVNATDVTYTWRTENPDVATVTNYGNVEAVAAKGATVIWCEAAGVSKKIDVIVPVKFSTAGWKVLQVSDETASDGGGMNTLIDGNLGTYWHSQWSGGNAPLPHWAIIDLAAPKTFLSINIYRRKGNTDTKTVQCFIGNSPDPDSDSWQLIAEGAFTTGDLLALETSASIAGRYLKIFLPDSNRSPFTAVAEIEGTGTE